MKIADILYAAPLLWVSATAAAQEMQPVCAGPDRHCLVAGDLAAGGVQVLSRTASAARIRVGRDMDLSGQAPVRFARSLSGESSSGPGAGVVIVSSTGRPADGVRLVAGVSAAGGTMAGGAMATAPIAVPAGMPVRSTALTSGYGLRTHPLLGGTRFHAGIDLAARAGDGVFATASGRVSAAGWRGGYGLMVTIDHGNGMESRYAHLSRLNVAPGEDVDTGALVGFVGSTGLSTGPHLHYEMRRFGQPIDPAATLRPRGR